MDEFSRFLDEDLGTEGDITSDSLFTDEKGKAKIIAKEDCVIAGLAEATSVFNKTGAVIKILFSDGDEIKKNDVVAEISGPLRSILMGERLALNFICRMSGIATETKNLVDKCRKINPNISIAATRKTTPGFRMFEKKAVILGGGESHRMGLYDVVMIKDNHIKAVGSLEKAITKVKQNVKDKIIEVEVENESDAYLVAKLDVDVIMLDNFHFDKLKEGTNRIREINPKIKIELSGGITPENIIRYAPYADRISLGYLTHSIRSRDFSLEII